MTFFTATTLSAVLLLVSANEVLVPQHGYRVVCYSRFVSPAEPALHMCTHLVYLGALLPTKDDDTTFEISTPHFFNDETIQKTEEFKQKFPYLTILVSVDGMGLGQTRFFESYVQVSKTAENRAKFIKSALKLVQDYGLHGIDIKWHFPAYKPDFVSGNINQIQLLKELRQEFDKHSLIVTVTIDSYSSFQSDLGVDSVGLSAQAHFLNVLSFEYKGFYNNALRHLKLGVPPAKINMAFMSEYFSYKISNSAESNIFRKKQEGADGGDMSYRTLCLAKENRNWTELWDSDASSPYSVDGKVAVYHDNNKSIHAKISFALEKRLGGVVFLDLGDDDYEGECVDSKGKYPLLRNIDETITELINPANDDIYVKLRTNWANYFWNGMKDDSRR